MKKINSIVLVAGAIIAIAQFSFVNGATNVEVTSSTTVELPVVRATSTVTSEVAASSGITIQQRKHSSSTSASSTKPHRSKREHTATTTEVNVSVTTRIFEWFSNLFK